VARAADHPAARGREGRRALTARAQDIAFASVLALGAAACGNDPRPAPSHTANAEVTARRPVRRAGADAVRDDVAARAFTARDYVPTRDAFEGAPAWTDPQPVLLATALADASTGQHAYAVSRDGRYLVVSHVAKMIGSWVPGVRVELADDVLVTLPELPVAAVTAGPVRVRIDERPWIEGNGLPHYLTSVRIGELVGPLLQDEAAIDRAQPWRYGPRPDLRDLPGW